jgi:ATP-dependent DNA ligase
MQSSGAENGKALLKHASSLDLEGIISKRRTSPYRSGKSDDWRKIMCPEYRRRRGKWMVLRPPDPFET